MKLGKQLLLMASSVAVFALATPASAIMSVPYGWYLEGNAGSTQLSNKSYPGNTSASGIGGNADIGYKFMPYFATEIGYTLYANTSISNGATGTKAGSDKHYSYDAALKGIVPIVDSGLELFGKLGIDRQNSSLSISSQAAATAIGLGSSTHSANGLYLAAGAQYYFIPELAVNVQWARAQGDSGTGTLDLVGVGISFIFD
jgi:hypothetical protein